VEATSRRAFLGLGFGGLAVAGAVVAKELLDSPPAGVDGLPLPAASPGMADDLCKSYAINTKLFYDTQVYGQTDAVIELLSELGVRTVRERVATGTSPGALAQRYAMPRLAERGIRWHATVGELGDWPVAEESTAAALLLLTDYYAPLVGDDLSVLLHSLGGCNEVDGPVVNGQVDPQWPAHARLMQDALWRQSQADPRTSSIPVVGPSTRTDVTAERAELLGDLSAQCDWGNAHLYNAGGSPSRLIDEQLGVLERCFPGVARWFFTETGYNNGPQNDAGRTVSEEAAATYVVRGICDYYLRNAVYGRFELLDDPDPIDFSSQESVNRTATREAHFGLVAMTEDTVAAATPDTWRKKPEFGATQRFLALMADPGPSFQPEPPGLALDGGDDDLQVAIVQKRNGRHYLLLWRDVEVGPQSTVVQASPSPVTVRLNRPRPVALYSPRHSAVPVRTYPDSQRSLTVEVVGDLLVLEVG